MLLNSGAIQEVDGRWVALSCQDLLYFSEPDVPQIHHAQDKRATGALTQIMRTKQEIRAAMSRGAIQYPRTHRPWKNDLCEEYRQRLVQIF